MDLDMLSRADIERYEAELLGGVPDAGVIGNKTLRDGLLLRGWTEPLYWHIRNRLVERGVLSVGRGKGGSVRRVSFDDEGEEPRQERPPGGKDVGGVISERELYGPMADVIRSHWAQDNRFDATVVEITAQQGARVTGGRWTRPDITLAGTKTLAYVPGRYFDVITFEIKPVDGIDVTVVYEALGHRRAATRSYALLHVPEERRDEFESLIMEILGEAKRFGVGVIVASNPRDYDSWEVMVEAARHEPDPERLNDFLAQQVSQDFRERIIKWCR